MRGKSTCSCTGAHVLFGVTKKLTAYLFGVGRGDFVTVAKRHQENYEQSIGSDSSMKRFYSI